MLRSSSSRWGPEEAEGWVREPDAQAESSQAAGLEPKEVEAPSMELGPARPAWSWPGLGPEQRAWSWPVPEPEQQASSWPVLEQRAWSWPEPVLEQRAWSWPVPVLEQRAWSWPEPVLERRAWSWPEPVPLGPELAPAVRARPYWELPAPELPGSALAGAGA